jgi:hypothetical protein
MRKAACDLHDQINMGLLPVIGGLAVGGLAGICDTAHATNAFILYIIVDIVWLARVPDAVPSLPKVVLVHHVITLLLLTFPLRFPAFGVFTCLVSPHAILGLQE